MATVQARATLAREVRRARSQRRQAQQAPGPGRRRFFSKADSWPEFRTGLFPATTIEAPRWAVLVHGRDETSIALRPSGGDLSRIRRAGTVEESAATWARTLADGTGEPTS